jgi:hypothetical protein
LQVDVDEKHSKQEGARQRDNRGRIELAQQLGAFFMNNGLPPRISENCQPSGDVSSRVSWRSTSGESWIWRVIGMKSQAAGGAPHPNVTMTDGSKTVNSTLVPTPVVSSISARLSRFQEGYPLRWIVSESRRDD